MVTNDATALKIKHELLYAQRVTGSHCYCRMWFFVEYGRGSKAWNRGVSTGFGMEHLPWDDALYQWFG